MTSNTRRSPDPVQPTEDHDRLRIALAAWSYLTEPGELHVSRLIRDHGPSTALDLLHTGDLPPHLLQALQPRMVSSNPWLIGRWLLEQARGAATRLAVPDDPDWPTCLTPHFARPLSTEPRPVNPSDIQVYPGDSRDDANNGPDLLDRMPQWLWVRGRADLRLLDRAVTVTGSRAATPYGTQLAYGLSAGLAEASWTVLAGGAYGIDAAVHRGALLGDGSTVAVLGSGADVAYPWGHEDLFRRISQSGLLVSELPPGTRPSRPRLRRRCELLAFIGRAVVLVEATRRSACLVVARSATRMGRTVMAVPGPVTGTIEPASAGTDAQAGTHVQACASALLVTDVRQVLDELDRSRTPYDGAPIRPGRGDR